MEAQETIQRINMALKLQENEEKRRKQLSQLPRNAFINVIREGYTHELIALMDTVADPIASEIFVECINRLDSEVHCKPEHQNLGYLETLNQEAWDAFRLALQKQKHDEYETNKNIILGTKGDEYYPNKPRVSYSKKKNKSKGTIETD